MTSLPIEEAELLETDERRKRDWLLISETFKTHQGEGPSAGQCCFFVRLGACNLHCTWCDTPYTWAFSERLSGFHETRKQYDAHTELKRRAIVDIAEKIWSANCSLNVISGGEPLLQQNPLAELISLVNEESPSRFTPGWTRFEIETAGTISPTELRMFTNVSYNVSPKLSGSGNPLDLRYHPEVLREFVGHPAVFKFVPDTRRASTMAADLVEIRDIVRECEIPAWRVYLMPCGTTSAEVISGMKKLAPVALSFGWNLSSRDHVLIYDAQRGH